MELRPAHPKPLAGGEALDGNMDGDLFLSAALRFAACLFSACMAPCAVVFISYRSPQRARMGIMVNVKIM